MNYNEYSINYSKPSSSGRKLIKRPLETPGLELNRPNSDSEMYTVNQQYTDYSIGYFQGRSGNNNNQPNETDYNKLNENSLSMPAENRILTDPLIANVAMQYGQVLVGSGKQFVDKEIEKYVSISRLKYYFAVDTSYVTRKLMIILFPYLRSDWSVKYDQNEPIQPKFEVNAPDLYIPTMAFLTYVLVTGLILGTKNQFSPERLSIEATNALAWTALEVAVQLIALYISNINTNLKTFDIIAYSSYKYIGILMTMLVNFVVGYIGYILTLIYTSSSVAFFLMRTLKLQILAEPMSYQQEVFGVVQGSVPHTGLRRRQYFLLIVACIQPTLIWWLTWRML